MGFLCIDKSYIYWAIFYLTEFFAIQLGLLYKKERIYNILLSVTNLDLWRLRRSTMYWFFRVYLLIKQTLLYCSHSIFYFSSQIFFFTCSSIIMPTSNFSSSIINLKIGHKVMLSFTLYFTFKSSLTTATANIKI